MSKFGHFLIGFEGRKNIVSPLIANIASAVLLFLLALAFRDRVVRLFIPDIKDYPITCIAESYTEFSESNSQKLRLYSELYIINWTEEVQTRNTLERFLLGRSRHPDTMIRIWSTDKDRPIECVRPDDVFNDSMEVEGLRRYGKGELIVRRSETDSGKWEIVIKGIIESAIMRCTISHAGLDSTDRYRGSTPKIAIDYPGVK